MRRFVHNAIAHPAMAWAELLVDLAELGLEVAETLLAVAQDLHDDTAPEPSSSAEGDG